MIFDLTEIKKKWVKLISHKTLDLFYLQIVHFFVKNYLYEVFFKWYMSCNGMFGSFDMLK